MPTTSSSPAVLLQLQKAVNQLLANKNSLQSQIDAINADPAYTHNKNIIATLKAGGNWMKPLDHFGNPNFNGQGQNAWIDSNGNLVGDFTAWYHGTTMVGDNDTKIENLQAQIDDIDQNKLPVANKNLSDYLHADPTIEAQAQNIVDNNNYSQKNTQYIIWGSIILVVLVIGGIVFYYMRKNKAAANA